MTTEIIVILIELFGTIATVVSLFLAIKELKAEKNRNIANTFLNEIISNLCEASAATYSFLTLSMKTSEDERKKGDRNLEKFIQGQRKVYNSILVHGDKKIITLFNQIFKDLKNDSMNYPSIYFRSCSMVLPLIVSNIKYYATGEKINPSIVFSYCMTKIKSNLDNYFVSRYYKDMVELNNKLVKKYRLKKFLIWDYEYSVKENQIWNIQEKLNVDNKGKVFIEVPSLTVIILRELKQEQEQEQGIYEVIGLFDEINSNYKMWKELCIDNVTKYIAADCIYDVSYKQLIGVEPIGIITEQTEIEKIKELLKK